LKVNIEWHFVKVIKGDRAKRSKGFRFGKGSRFMAGCRIDG